MAVHRADDFEEALKNIYRAGRTDTLHSGNSSDGWFTGTLHSGNSFEGWFTNGALANIPDPTKDSGDVNGQLRNSRREDPDCWFFCEPEYTQLTGLTEYVDGQCYFKFTGPPFGSNTCKKDTDWLAYQFDPHTWTCDTEHETEESCTSSGSTWNGGENTDTPGCEDCWCCKPSNAKCDLGEAFKGVSAFRIDSNMDCYAEGV